MSEDRTLSIVKPTSSAVAGLEQLLTRPLTELDLDRATAALAAPLDERSRSRISLLVMRAGGEMLAILAGEAAKVVVASTIHRVPHRSNKIFRGLSNHDGELLLCMSIEAALGVPAPAKRERSILVVAEQGRERWAFEVDAIVGVADVDEGSLRAPPMTISSAKSGCARALARIEEGEAVVLDIHSLFSIFRGATS
jgi:chemotaxis-related protein WspD